MLELIGNYGTKGWSNIVDSNTQKLEIRLTNIFTANKIAGTASVANLSASTLTDPALTVASLTDNSGGTSSTTLVTCSDTNIDNNFATLADQHNKLITDLTAIISYLIINTTQDANTINKINALLVELRKGTGAGILA